MEKRVQGRPSQAAGVVGRQKIVEDVRAVLRLGQITDTSRKSLALAIGITPALITYYFPDKETFLEAVTVPVIEGYRIKLTGIVNRPTNQDLKLRDIISLLSELYGKDRKIFDIYRSFETMFPDDYAETVTMTGILSEFFSGSESGAQLGSFEAAVLQGAVRGMCEFAERVSQNNIAVEPAASLSTAASDVSSTWLEAMVDFFANARQSSSKILMPPRGEAFA